MTDKTEYTQEWNDIQYYKKRRKIFIGEIDSTVSIRYSLETPMNFYPIHLNRTLLGMFTDNLKGGAKIYVFGCSNSSIYKLLSEIEYIRIYSKYKQLKIDVITIYIYSISNKIIHSNIKDDDYSLLHQTETADINRSYKLPRFFSGSVHAKNTIRCYNIEEKIEKEGDFNSVYQLVAELEEHRNISAKLKQPIQDISIELTDLDDSRIKVDPELMKFYEEEDLEDNLE
ncbi:MAG: hypothetical protein ACFFG0_48425 [Candidatus Thorarchaeota archaeon]